MSDAKPEAVDPHSGSWTKNPVLKIILSEFLFLQIVYFFNTTT